MTNFVGNWFDLHFDKSDLKWFILLNKKKNTETRQTQGTCPEVK